MQIRGARCVLISLYISLVRPNPKIMYLRFVLVHVEGKAEQNVGAEPGHLWEYCQSTPLTIGLGMGLETDRGLNLLFIARRSPSMRRLS